MKTTDPAFALLVATGSVAAGNLPGLAHLIMERLGVPTVALLTRQARRFVTTETLLHMGGVKMVVHDGTPTIAGAPNHVWLSSQAVGTLVYPASAGFIGKMASGLATDLASTTLLCCLGKPILIAPSMHPKMWNHPLVQRNVRVLSEIGMGIAPTEDGMPAGVHEIQELFGRMLDGQKVISVQVTQEVRDGNANARRFEPRSG